MKDEGKWRRAREVAGKRRRGCGEMITEGGRERREERRGKGESDLGC